ncbi:MAG: hypothetical protein D6675_10805 [Gemmatimonadetes bacterium]|nr:MAG: hypothetical protein D6675_10805 [Gemmatimonadota bacterium]
MRYKSSVSHFQYWLLGVLLLWTPLLGAETIFIYNPEAGVSNVDKVRQNLIDYLESQHITADVYVFANPDDFQRAVDQLKPDVAIVASYYYESMKSHYNWKSILAGHYEQTPVFTKVLVVSKSISLVQNLKNKSLATVSAGAVSQEYLNAQLPEELRAQDVRVMSVSKDIDAIMALGFDQVDGAIVTPSSLEKLRQINPNVVDQLHILQELKPIAYPKVVVFPQTQNVDRFISVFKDMPYQGATKVVLRYFGITGFNVES